MHIADPSDASMGRAGHWSSMSVRQSRLLGHLLRRFSIYGVPNGRMALFFSMGSSFSIGAGISLLNKTNLAGGDFFQVFS